MAATMDARVVQRQRFHDERAQFWDQRAAELQGQPALPPGPVADLYVALLAQPRPATREALIAECQRLEVLYTLLRCAAAAATADPTTPPPGLYRERVPVAAAAAAAVAATGTATPAAADGTPSSDVPTSAVSTSPGDRDVREADDAAAVDDDDDGGRYTFTTASSVPTSELFTRRPRAGLADVTLTPLDRPARATSGSVGTGTATSAADLNDDDDDDDDDDRGLRTPAAAVPGARATWPPPTAPLGWARDDVLTATTATATDDALLDVPLLAGRYRQLPPRPAHFSTPAPLPAAARARASVAPPAPQPPAPASTASSHPERVLSEDLRRFLYRSDSALASAASGSSAGGASVDSLYAEWRTRYRRIVRTMEGSHR
jgi:hypothetical protein